MTINDELERLGPDARAVHMAPADAQAYCRNLAKTHYENFPVLSWFVPPALRQDFANVYAYCRWADDLGDEVGDVQRATDLLDWWEDELLACYASAPRHPVMIALAGTIRRCDIPREPFADLLTAFRRDQVQTRYPTFPDLLDYCRCSANPVGRLVLYVCKRYTPQNADWSDSICTGLQLANFWQDVARDLDKGRVYLPTEDLDRFHVPEHDLTARRYSPAFADLLAFQVARADEFLKAGRPLIAGMPGRLRVVVAAFINGGRTILRKIRNSNYNVIERRPKLGRADVFGVLARSVGDGFLAQGASRAAVHQQAESVAEHLA